MRVAWYLLYFVASKRDLSSGAVSTRTSDRLLRGKERVEGSVEHQSPLTRPSSGLAKVAVV